MWNIALGLALCLAAPQKTAPEPVWKNLNVQEKQRLADSYVAQMEPATSVECGGWLSTPSYHIFNTLRKLGKAAVPTLSRTAHDPLVWKRSQAVYLLGEIRDKKAFDVLLKVWQEDSEEFMRVLAAEALGKLGDKRAISVLQEKLHSEQNAIVFAAAKGIVQLDKKRLLAFLRERLWNANQKEHETGKGYKPHLSTLLSECGSEGLDILIVTVPILNPHSNRTKQGDDIAIR